MTSAPRPSSTFGGMTRARAVALLAAGCVLAVASASAGPFLVADSEAPPFQPRRRPPVFDLEKLRRPGSDDGGGPLDTAASVVDVLLQGLLLLALAALVIYGAFRMVRAIVRLVRLRRGGTAAAVRAAPYDPGEESYDDAETALRKRVADDLRLLSADLDADVEPREAVIACYVRMEAALAGAGTPRDATETPLELLSRVLDAYDVPEPDVRRLTDLFTEARFSDHPVTGEMRDAARRSLAAVADALAGAPA